MIYSFVTFLPALAGLLLGILCFYRAMVANIEMSSAGILILASIGFPFFGAMISGLVLLIQNFGVCT